MHAIRILCLGMMVWGVSLTGAVYATDASEPLLAERVATQLAVNLERYGQRKDVMVRSGLVADRSRRRVELLAEATGLESGDPVEFLVIDVRSGHGYESLLWSHASPADLRAGLEFIGLKPGAPFNPGAMRLLPRGERVMMRVQRAGETVVDVASLLIDSRSKKAPPRHGFVFGGCLTNDAGELLAELGDPYSLVSLFNTPATVLDVPRKAAKSDVYQSHVMGSNVVLTAHELVTLVLEPADDTFPLRDIALDVDLEGDAIRVTMHQSGEASPRVVRGLPALLQQLKAQAMAGVMPYVTLHHGAQVPVDAARKVAEVLGLLEDGGAIAMEPPPPGQLYYRAFLPDATWRDHAKRFGQPWEVHLSRSDGVMKGRMVRYEADWTTGSGPTYRRIAFDAPSGEQLRARLASYEPPKEEGGGYANLNAVFVFASPVLAVSDVVAYLAPVRERYPIVYVFTETAKP